MNIISRHIKSEDSHWARRKNVFFDRKYPPEVSTGSSHLKGNKRSTKIILTVLNLLRSRGQWYFMATGPKIFGNRKCPIVTQKVFSSDTMIIKTSNSIWPESMRSYLVRGQPARIRVNNTIHMRSRSKIFFGSHP